MDKDTWLAKKLAELDASCERIKSRLLPVQRLNWEVAKAEREALEGRLRAAEEVMEQIADLPLGCTPSIAVAVSLAKGWLEGEDDGSQD